VGRASRRKKEARIDTTHLSFGFTCPACHRRCDAITGASMDMSQPAMPQPGDPLICGYCHAVQIWLRDSVRLATSEECAALPSLARELLQHAPIGKKM